MLGRESGFLFLWRYVCFVFIAAELACSAAEKALLDEMVYCKSVCGILGQVCMFGRRGCGQMVCGDCL